MGPVQRAGAAGGEACRVMVCEGTPGSFWRRASRRCRRNYGRRCIPRGPRKRKSRQRPCGAGGTTRGAPVHGGGCGRCRSVSRDGRRGDASWRRDGEPGDGAGAGGTMGAGASLADRENGNHDKDPVERGGGARGASSRWGAGTRLRSRTTVCRRGPGGAGAAGSTLTLDASRLDPRIKRPGACRGPLFAAHARARAGEAWCSVLSAPPVIDPGPPAGKSENRDKHPMARAPTPRWVGRASGQSSARSSSSIIGQLSGIGSGG
jgi:hypothetical protein